MKKVLITGPLYKNTIDKMKKIAPNYQFIIKSHKEVNKKDIFDADIIIGNVSPDLVKKHSHLEWLQLESAGANNYLECIQNNTLLTCMSGAYGIAISEYLIAYLLMMMKKGFTYFQNQKERLWANLGAVESPRNKRVLILGTGNIGQEFAKRIKALGAYTIGMNQSLKSYDCFDEIHSISNLKLLIEKVDIIVITLPATAKTYHLINQDVLKYVKKGSYLLNVGRGSVIDTKSLIHYASLFQGIYLDVFEEEPLDSSCELYQLNNVYMTPHITGGYQLSETVDIINDIALENFTLYINKKPLKNIVNVNEGYASFSK